MMAPDIWSWLWLLVDQYPWLVAIFVFLVLSFVGTVVACALLALTRREDDQVQHRYTSKPADAPTPWGRSGGNWWPRQ